MLLAGKICVHVLLVLLHMKLSEHNAFAAASSTAQHGSEKEEKSEHVNTSVLDDLHQKQASFLLKTCWLPQYSALLHQMLNRRVAPGECPVSKAGPPGTVCASLSSTNYESGKSRGVLACLHSFPNEFHVNFTTCPDPACGTHVCERGCHFLQILPAWFSGTYQARLRCTQHVSSFRLSLSFRFNVLVAS